jgi:hypothetical protein
MAAHDSSALRAEGAGRLRGPGGASLPLGGGVGLTAHGGAPAARWATAFGREVWRHFDTFTYLCQFGWEVTS